VGPSWIEQVTVFAAATGGLLLLRAAAAALEAALVAVGLPRAQLLAAAPTAGRRERALEALAGDPEATGFVLRVVGTASTLGLGLLASFAGPAVLPALPHLAGALLLGLAGLALALAVSAWSRSAGAATGEATALALAPSFRAAQAVLRPLARLLGGRHARFSLPRPPLDEMERALAEAARAAGRGAEATTELIHNVLEFREKVARDVMVPRTDAVAIEIDTPVPEIIRILAEEGHSRMPVYRESLDQVVGVLHARDLVPLLAHPELIVLRDLVRPAHFVPWSKPVDQLLRLMQRRHVHMLFVVDEYGGVMGLTTLEDVLAEIVGEMPGDFERDDGRAIEPHADGTWTVQGWTPIAEFNEAARAQLPTDLGAETVAGFVNTLHGAIPAKGDKLSWRGWTFTVVDGDARHVTKVRVARVKRQG
jgi:CBS domain containing-hemolysin-like protein